MERFNPQSPRPMYDEAGFDDEQDLQPSPEDKAKRPRKQPAPPKPAAAKKPPAKSAAKKSAAKGSSNDPKLNRVVTKAVYHKLPRYLYKEGLNS